MNCEKLESDLAIYFDDVLSPAEISAVDGHLDVCPLCRQKMSEFQNIRRDFHLLPAPILSESALASLREKITDAAAAKDDSLDQRFAAWRASYLFPTLAGSAGSILIGFMILWSLMTANSGISDDERVYAKISESSTMLANAAAPAETGDYEDPVIFANERLSISDVSPSVNPRGALIALTKSFIRGEMKDDEVVVVADVFGNGLAQIAEVVEPSSDRERVRELEKALRSNPDFAPPFMPANMDNRSDVVRVVLRFQTVNVDTRNLPSN